MIRNLYIGHGYEAGTIDISVEDDLNDCFPGEIVTIEELLAALKKLGVISE